MATAHALHLTEVPPVERRSFPAWVTLLCWGAAALGALIWGFGFATSGNTLRSAQSLLLVYMLFMMLGLGGLVFSTIQYAASARWSIVVRRLAESFTAFLPIGFVLFLVIMFFFSHELFYAPIVMTDHGAAVASSGVEGTVIRPDFAGEGQMEHAKVVFLSKPVVLVKGIVFWACWLGFAWAIVWRNGHEREQARKAHPFELNQKLSIAFLIVFGVTFTFHAMDMLLGLEPRWFSTMFGVYAFAGLFLSTLATLTLLTHVMRANVPIIREVIQYRHLYDLGTWMMAFSCFMAYIGFSQFMLIWYANLPEETFYLLHRMNGGWKTVFQLLPVLKWIIPFLVLMPQALRANARIHVVVCLVILAGQWLDLYWMIYPTFSKAESVMPALPEIGALLAGIGLFGVAVSTFFAYVRPLPTGDPHLLNSINGGYL